MKRILILVAAALMTACQPMPASDRPTELAGVTPGVRSVAGSQDAAACAAAGGKMLPQGRMQTVRCVISYADAGTRCTDGDDCAGDCRVEDVANAPAAGTNVVGQCQASSSRFGCYTTVEDGKAEATLCVD
jgi:hypothetical protein